MRKFVILLLAFAGLQGVSHAQETESQPKQISLEQALQIALSENISVKVADMEIERTGYAKKGSYASILPNIDGSASYQRTIKRQVMYMDFDMSKLGGSLPGGMSGTTPGTTPGTDSGTTPGTDSGEAPKSNDGIEVGRWNTWSTGITASMPIINAQVWQSIKIAGIDVELAVEKARSSRIDMVNQVKQAFFTCLLSKEAFNVYKSVYENALQNYELVEKRYNVQKASELELTRAKTSLANAIPNVYDAESSVILALWQLKAVMGVSLDENIDVAGKLEDYGQTMLYDIAQNGGAAGAEEINLDNNSSMRQLAIQAEQLAASIKAQEYAYLPSLAVSFAYNLNAMTNDFNFKEYKWNPNSYVGLSLQIPIFSGGRRYHAVKQAKVQAQELDLQILNTERQLKIAIRQYLNKMDTAMKTYTASQSALESATKAFDFAQKSYNVGRSTLTDLNDAQLALTQSQLGVSQAIYNFVVAKANLESTLGADFTENNNDNE